MDNELKTTKGIEQACRRNISIESIEHDDSLAKCNPQYQSPLFGALPREIRELIWSFATAPFEDESKRYAANGYYCRPGHRAAHRTYTDLLYTCRRIWLEANALPMLQAEHCFWYYRAAPDSRNAAWMANLTDTNRNNFGELHLFAQMFAIEGLSDEPGRLRKFFLDSRERNGDFQPRVLHVTIRHTDWWFWEHEEPLRFEDAWFEAMLNTPDLRSTQTLRLELETLDYKVGQLRPIVERLKRLESREYETHVVDGKRAKTKFVFASEDVSTWSGPADIDGHTYSPYQGKTTLDYHVVTLIWHLRFPSIPRAHIPELRRAPRINAPNPLPTTWEEHDADAFPPRPRPSQFYLRPSAPGGLSPVQRTARRLRVKRKRGDAMFETQEEEDTQRRLAWQGRQAWSLAVHKYQGVSEVLAQRTQFLEKMAQMHRRDVERGWEREGKLLRFA